MIRSPEEVGVCGWEGSTLFRGSEVVSTFSGSFELGGPCSSSHGSSFASVREVPFETDLAGVFEFEGGSSEAARL